VGWSQLVAKKTATSVHFMSKILLRRFVEKIFVTRNGFFGEELPNVNKIS
jgi:hypothetical protein